MKLKLLSLLLVNILSLNLFAASKDEPASAESSYKVSKTFISARSEPVPGQARDFEFFDTAKLDQTRDEAQKLLTYLDSTGIADPILVMGVSNDFPENPERLQNDSYVFLDNRIDTNAHDFMRSICANFNNIHQLTVLAKMFAGKFEAIYLEDSTLKSTKWTYFHIHCLKKMLKDGGRFVMPVNIASICSDSDKSQYYDQSMTEDYLIKNNVNRSAEIEHQIKVFAKVDDYNSVNFDIVFSAEHFAKKEYISKYNVMHPPVMTLTELHKGLRTGCTLFSGYLATVRPELVKIYSNYCFRFMEQVFGPSNVIVEYDVQLPQGSQYQDKQKAMLTCLNLG